MFWKQVELSNPDAELRLLEVFYHKIYKACHFSKFILVVCSQIIKNTITCFHLCRYSLWMKKSRTLTINTGLYVLRRYDILLMFGLCDFKYLFIYSFCWGGLLLQVPEEEKELGPQDRLIHVYHFMKDTAQNQVRVFTFSWFDNTE